MDRRDRLRACPSRPRRSHRRDAVTVLAVLVTGALLAGCRDSPEHRYMLFNDTSGQRQVSLCTDDDCSTASSVGWVDLGAYADVTLPGNRVVLRVTSVGPASSVPRATTIWPASSSPSARIAPAADEAAQRCIK